MDTEINIFKDSIHQSWLNLVSHLPKIFLALVIFIIGLLIIRLINKYAKKIIISKSDDPLIADFILSVISLVLTVLLFVISLGILGFDDVTNKILAGAGLTTFIIGFALKDIGENFIAGILMAFQRPFRIGDLIEIDGIKGRVIEMRLRSTTIKTVDGIDAYIPNGSILKNNLKNYTIDELMRNEFILTVVHDERIHQAIAIIDSTLNKNEFVLKTPMYDVLVDKIENDTVNILVLFWYKTDEVRAPGGKLKTDLQLDMYAALKSEGFNLPTTTLSVEQIEKK
ncbi:putative transporter (transmembrane protein) [Mariniflexile fucanivorans]|uniref:Putative transporter (Transmembrane protein) n=1 Tax=Mariniflexile fucanivorans TaxID=264023 RepID=A0A4R1RN32_9FLAO|nr:mechanosensitive ion channel family protein [Mariniflexile fucanivorans]TCL67614.1 putative transporter (transmembrane protein) [Mariniflexile fucanivorans]